SCYDHHLHLHSFPTRRSSDLDAQDNSSPLKGKRIVHSINRVFGDNTILVLENGAQDLWAYYWPYYQVKDAGCVVPPAEQTVMGRSEEHTSELQSRENLVCRLL